MKQSTKLMFLAFVVIASLSIPVSTANAAPGVHDAATISDISSLPLAQANPQVSLDVIASLPVALQERGDLYIDPSITSQTPLITVDGRPVEGQTPRMMAAAANCGSSMWGVSTTWSNPYPSNCGVVGSSGTKVVYTFSTAGDNQGCYQGKGFKPVYKIPTTEITGYSEYWLGRGCSDGIVTVDWGNVAAVPAGKIMSFNILGGASGAFRH